MTSPAWMPLASAGPPATTWVTSTPWIFGVEAQLLALLGRERRQGQAQLRLLRARLGRLGARHLLLAGHLGDRRPRA